MKYLLLSIGILTTLMANAQHPYSWQLTEDNGLPSNVVYDLLQDSRGYMWMGADRGLVKYNGVDFQVYSTLSQKSLSLTGLQEDELGRIWCVNFSQQIFYTDGDSLVELTFRIPKGSARINHVNIELADDLLYIYSYGFIHSYNVLSGEWVENIYANNWPMSETSDQPRSLIKLAASNSELALNFGNEVHFLKDGKPLGIAYQKGGDETLFTLWNDGAHVAFAR